LEIVCIEGGNKFSHTRMLGFKCLTLNLKNASHAPTHMVLYFICYC